VFPSLGTNVRSVAESIGVPKETVRRKVGQLAQAGWIARQGNELRFTALAYQQLAGVRVTIEQLAVRNFEVVAELLRLSAARAPGD
jgi:DNA-binding IclR family transcriptional regulator